jgi:hypothetical protein
MSMWGFVLLLTKKTPNITNNGRITNAKQISRCLSVIRDLFMHFTCFIPVNISLHKYALEKSKIMKSVCLWVPGYFSCETQFIAQKEKLLNLSFKSDAHWKSAHSICRSPGPSFIIMQNGDEKRLKLKLLRLKSRNPDSISCLNSHIILTHKWKSRNYTSAELEIARNYAFQLWFPKK